MSAVTGFSEEYFAISGDDGLKNKIKLPLKG